MGNWFDTDSKKGKVTVAQQLTGLNGLPDLVIGATVFDLGCAEGQIAALCKHWGAKAVHGVDNRLDAVDHAVSLGVDAVVADAGTYSPPESHDIVLLLGILHKLKNPARTLERMLRKCNRYCVIRLPADQWPVLCDGRSGHVPFDLAKSATACGFYVERISMGPRGQWVGFLRRLAA